MSNSTVKPRLPIPRIGFLAATAAVCILCLGGSSLANAGISTDKGVVADKAVADEKDNSSRPDSAPPSKTDTSKNADSANSGPAPAPGSTEDQLLRLGDKVKKL